MFFIFFFFISKLTFIFFFFFFKQKTAYEVDMWLEFRRVLFRSRLVGAACGAPRGVPERCRCRTRLTCRGDRPRHVDGDGQAVAGGARRNRASRADPSLCGE